MAAAYLRHTVAGTGSLGLRATASALRTNLSFQHTPSLSPALRTLSSSSPSRPGPLLPRALPPTFTPQRHHSASGGAAGAAVSARGAVSATPDTRGSPASAGVGLKDPQANAVLGRLERVPQPWQWQPQGSTDPITIRAAEFRDPSAPEQARPASASEAPVVLLLPAPSDVAVIEEWNGVAACLLAGEAHGGARVLGVDWPGFGGSGSPPLLYTADLLEDFLVDFVQHLFPGQAGSPLPLVIVGAGHAPTLALRAVAKGRISPASVVAVAPTWGGPLPIVFGNDEKMTFRYGVLRSLLRAPGVGWGLYRYLTSPKRMTMQYRTHVYADPANISDAMIEQRTEITRREGGRFAPASFISGLLDPAKDRDEFLSFFRAAGEEKGVSVAVLASSKSPKRSKKEMESLQGSPGVEVYETVAGALLPHEEFPEEVYAGLEKFLLSKPLKGSS